ncbi:MFS transporter, partial [Acinetobacter baumannii]
MLPTPSEVAYRGRLPRYMRDSVLMAARASAAIMQASHAMVYSFSSLYWQARGFSGGEVGAFWAIGVVAEILMFFVSGR